MLTYHFLQKRNNTNVQHKTSSRSLLRGKLCDYVLSFTLFPLQWTSKVNDSKGNMILVLSLTVLELYNARNKMFQAFKDSPGNPLGRLPHKTYF